MMRMWMLWRRSWGRSCRGWVMPSRDLDLVGIGSDNASLASSVRSFFLLPYDPSILQFPVPNVPTNLSLFGSYVTSPTPYKPFSLSPFPHLPCPLTPHLSIPRILIRPGLSLLSRLRFHLPRLLLFLGNSWLISNSGKLRVA